MNLKLASLGSRILKMALEMFQIEEGINLEIAEVKEGEVAYLVTPEGEENLPVPAGTYPLPDGREIMCDESGKITKVVEAGADPEEMEKEQEEQLQKLQAQLSATLPGIVATKQELAAVKAENDNLKSEVETMKADLQKANESMEALQTLMEGIKKNQPKPQKLEDDPEGGKVVQEELSDADFRNLSPQDRIAYMDV